MPKNDYFHQNYEARLQRRMGKLKWQSLHIDPTLLSCLLLLAGVGLVILYSASNQNVLQMSRQVFRFMLGFGLMYALAQVPPRTYAKITPWFFALSLLSLFIVLVIGKTGHGAQRWLAIGPIRFQPSELMKLAMPMMLAWYLKDRNLGPSLKDTFVCGVLLILPFLLTAAEPDLGTAIIILATGLFVLFLAGLNRKIIYTAFGTLLVAAPFLWHFMHDYQRERVLTFLNPERDPLGTGYHIIQSKIAIGSGGLIGKGLLNGTQSHLQFLPEHATDFIFAVSGEELGLIGCILLLTIFMLIFGRAVYMSYQAQNTYTRLLSGSISFSFFLAMFINIGMVIGILPVVGVPLPLISYGGTSIVTMLAGFGILMSIHTHRKLYSS